MNRKQWLVLGVGLIILGIYLISTANGWGGCSSLLNDGNLYVGCVVRRYAYAIPAIITHFLGWLFFICAWLEPKKK